MTDDVEFGEIKGMGNILNPDKDNSFINLVKTEVVPYNV